MDRVHTPGTKMFDEELFPEESKMSKKDNLSEEVFRRKADTAKTF